LVGQTSYRFHRLFHIPTPPLLFLTVQPSTSKV
jgi:hypothetical protein